mmetsp:Transcript_20773/g.30748  ORF Transcript_20773/g.30748 Transcript_20773/m.30748 type:complete len:127 (-) Transcript_20773:284-664(-)|eukprot:CAMPEP_0194210866 /NCGR_PEP_ID=MMETSP0156-20130528/9157_1 /TAXON_ID=33649 /ORGANISM="Thalassionema nitzschioides, Strain L26-B" /LENGTH=126 /DNA_ID=CAMNT_0038938277 /DNA_START=76 /DNA_END=456 /DNA_ORIENTATION=-
MLSSFHRANNRLSGIDLFDHDGAIICNQKAFQSGLLSKGCHVQALSEEKQLIVGIDLQMVTGKQKAYISGYCLVERKLGKGKQTKINPKGFVAMTRGLNIQYVGDQLEVTGPGTLWFDTSVGKIRG